MTFFRNQNVTTPYGNGTFLGPSKNPNIIIVQPTQWTMARETKPTFFLNPKDVKPIFVVGSTVYTIFGGGTITEFRELDCMYVVTLADWKLAQGQSPSLYLQESAMSITPLIPAYKKTLPVELVPEPAKVPYAESCIAKAMAIKDEAGIFYNSKDYATARDKYLKALEAIQYLGESLSNEQKATVFEQTVPCHNNISLCCMQLKSYGESAQFARNGLMLITALEERMPDGLVWQCLLERGMTANKLLKEWKTKSYFLAGKAELLRKEYDSSIAFLESGLKFLNDDPQYLEKITKLKELLSTATKKRAEELKKEKSTWSKAFQKNKAELDKVEIESVAAAEQARVETTKEDEKDDKTIEDILKSMNINSASHTSAAQSSTRVGAAAESVSRGSKATVPKGLQEEEEEGEGGGLSDETFGWMIGATTVIGVLGVAAFFILKSRQR